MQNTRIRKAQRRALRRIDESLVPKSSKGLTSNWHIAIKEVTKVIIFNGGRMK